MKEKIANYLILILGAIVFANVIINQANAAIKESSKLELNNAYTAGLCNSINAMISLSIKEELDPTVIIRFIKIYSDSLEITPLIMGNSCVIIDKKFIKNYDMAVK